MGRREKRVRDPRTRGRLGRGAALSLLLHLQLLVPGLIATWIYAGRQEAQLAEEVDVAFLDATSQELPADLPPLESVPPPRDSRSPLRAETPPPPTPPEPEDPAPAVPAVPVQEPPPPPPPEPSPPPQRAHEKMVDLDMGQDVEPPPDAKFLAQKNNRVQEETRATDTNLEREQKGGEASSPSERQDDKVGDDKQKVAELEDVSSALGRKAPAVTPHADPHAAAEAARQDARSLLAMRDAPQRDHEVTPETADPSLPRDPEGALPAAEARELRGPRAMEARTRARGPVKLRLTGQDYEYIFGADAEAERRLAQQERSRRVGRHEKRWGRIQSALENFIPEVRPGNQTALNTRAAPFAAYIARMHRSIHKLWGFGMLEDWDEKPGQNAFNNPNLAATLEVVLNGDGTVDKVTVVRPSGYLPYDVAAIDVAYSAGPYPDPPREIRSKNGKIYIHWGFHRDHRQCATSGVDYYILDNAPAGSDRPPRAGEPPGGAPSPSPRATGSEEGGQSEAQGEGLRRLDRPLRDAAAGSSHHHAGHDPEHARQAATQVARADDPQAREVAERWFAAYARADVPAMVKEAAFPFGTGMGAIAKNPRELTTLFADLVAEASGKRVVRAVEIYSVAGARGRLGKLPPGVAASGAALFATGHVGGDSFVLALVKRTPTGPWRAIGLARR